MQEVKPSFQVFRARRIEPVVFFPLSLDGVTGYLSDQHERPFEAPMDMYSYCYPTPYSVGNHAICTSRINRGGEMHRYIGYSSIDSNNHFKVHSNPYLVQPRILTLLRT